MNQGVEDVLDRPLWPWPLAVAYLGPDDCRADALGAAVQVLQEVGGSNWPVSEMACSWAMECIATAMGATDHQTQIQVLRANERPLIRAIEAGRIKSWGRRFLEAELDPIPPTAWVGGGVVYQGRCNLVPEQWLAEDEEENFFGVSFCGKEPAIWFFDIWVSRDSMLKVFGDRPRPDAADLMINAEAAQPRPQIVSTAAAIGECERWLNEQFARRETAGLAKPEFADLANIKFEGRLSGRGFKEAWRRAIRGFPERGTPGAKRKSDHPD